MAITNKTNDLVNRRMMYLFDTTGIDYILETRDCGRDFTEFVTSQGGDVCRYRVYGTDEDNFKLYAK